MAFRTETHVPNWELKGNVSVCCQTTWALLLNPVEVGYCGRASLEEHWHNLRVCVAGLLNEGARCQKKNADDKKIWWRGGSTANDSDEEMFRAVYEALCSMEDWLDYWKEKGLKNGEYKTRSGRYLSYVLYAERTEDESVFLACLLANRGFFYEDSVLPYQDHQIFVGYLEVLKLAKHHSLRLPIDIQEMLFDYVLQTDKLLKTRIVRHVFEKSIATRYNDKSAVQLKVLIPKGDRVPYFYILYPGHGYQLHAILADNLLVVAKPEKTVRSVRGVLRHFFRWSSKLPSEASAFASRLDGLIVFSQMKETMFFRDTETCPLTHIYHDALFWFRPGGRWGGFEQALPD